MNGISERGLSWLLVGETSHAFRVRKDGEVGGSLCQNYPRPVRKGAGSRCRNCNFIIRPTYPGWVHEVWDAQP